MIQSRGKRARKSGDAAVPTITPDAGGGGPAEGPNQIAVGAAAEGGVEVDDRHLAVEGEAARQIERVLRRGEHALGAAPELHRAPPHQVDARNDHRRTTIPAASRRAFASPIDRRPSWKIEAARTASASPSIRTLTRSSADPAPPDAITGIVTVRATARVSARSYPARVPSASTAFSRISPAPSRSASRAQASAPIPRRLRPPWLVASQPAPQSAASTHTTTHW